MCAYVRVSVCVYVCVCIERELFVTKYFHHQKKGRNVSKEVETNQLQNNKELVTKLTNIITFFMLLVLIADKICHVSIAKQLATMIFPMNYIP